MIVRKRGKKVLDIYIIENKIREVGLLRWRMRCQGEKNTVMERYKTNKRTIRWVGVI